MRSHVPAGLFSLRFLATALLAAAATALPAAEPDTCGGDWLVDDARDLPWTVYVQTLSLSYSGSPSVSFRNPFEVVIG